MRPVLFLFSLAAFLAPALAEAGIIRLTIEAKVEEGADPTQRTLNVAVENQGDESAFEVGLEIVGTKRTKLLADALPAGGKIQNALPISLEELGISGLGRFIVPLRILYRDSNRYPFSAPSVASLDTGPPPARAVAVLNPQGRPVPPIELSSTAEAKLILRALSAETVTLDQIQFLTAAEITADIRPNQYPVQVTEHAQLPISVRLTAAGVMPGSTYPGLLIVSGEIGGNHFAEPFPIPVSIVEAPPPPGSNNLWILGVVICLGAAAFLIRKLRYCKGGSLA